MHPADAEGLHDEIRHSTAPRGKDLLPGVKHKIVVMSARGVERDHRVNMPPMKYAALGGPRRRHTRPSVPGAGPPRTPEWSTG